MATKENIKNQIFELVDEFYKIDNKELPDNIVPVAGKVYDSEELKNIIEAALQGWWTENIWVDRFEDMFKKFLGVNNVLMVNSGSSANLLAIYALTSPKLGERRIKKGDEVITVAVGFPTTINPIVQIGAIPVFLDVKLSTYSIKTDDLDEALSDRTRAIMIAHTLGNPFNIDRVIEFCKKNNLWLIEDNCDSLGSKYNGKYTGTFGDIATSSFYPAHHITTAEGGAVYTDNKELDKIARSIRDWGKSCFCPTGKDNTCKKRFGWKLGDLPEGYDHKYIYSEIGFNLKMTDLQASIGVAQMDKLPEFIKKRKDNFKTLKEKLIEFEDYFILPEAEENSDPVWFGFLLTIKDEKINRKKLLTYLNNNGIATRLLFGGNIIKQPYFIDNNINYRKIGNLENTDKIMNDSFWVGIYPMITSKQINYIYKTIKEFICDGNK